MTKVVRVKTPGGIEQFEVAEVELAPLAAGEVRIRQTAIGVNFVDIYQRSGLYPMPPANKSALITTVETDDKGAYAFKDLEAKAYRVYCIKQDGITNRTADKRVTVEPGKTLPLELELSK